MFHSLGTTQSKIGVPLSTSVISSGQHRVDDAQGLADAVAGQAPAERIELAHQLEHRVARRRRARRTAHGASCSFRHRNASANPVGELASMPRMRIRPRKMSSVNQCRERWEAKPSSSSSIFRFDDGLVERDEDVRRAEIAVVLRDLELEDQVVAEGVPGQLGDEPVILVEVRAGVREHQLRRHGRLQPLERLLDVAAGVREEAVPERLEHDGGLALGARQERCRARPRLVGTLAGSR